MHTLKMTIELCWDKKTIGWRQNNALVICLYLFLSFLSVWILYTNAVAAKKTSVVIRLRRNFRASRNFRGEMALHFRFRMALHFRFRIVGCRKSEVSLVFGIQCRSFFSCGSCLLLHTHLKTTTIIVIIMITIIIIIIMIIMIVMMIIIVMIVIMIVIVLIILIILFNLSWHPLRCLLFCHLLLYLPLLFLCLFNIISDASFNLNKKVYSSVHLSVRSSSSTPYVNDLIWWNKKI